MIREKRSLTLHGHRTSVALEPSFWAVIDQEAKGRNMSMAGLLMQIDDQRVMEKSQLGLAAYLRVWALATVQKNKPSVKP